MATYSDDLEETAIDQAAAIAEITAIAGVSLFNPFFGWMLAFVFKSFPNSRMERLKDFCAQTEEQIRRLRLDHDALREAVARDPEAAALAEDTLSRAFNSHSASRRRRLASLLINGLAGERPYERTESMLMMLDQLSDEEIIRLKYYSLDFHDREVFKALHRRHFPVQPVLASSPEEKEAYALKGRMTTHLQSLGLITDPAREVKPSRPVASLAPGDKRTTPGARLARDPVYDFPNPIKTTTAGDVFLRFIGELDASEPANGD